MATTGAESIKQAGQKVEQTVKRAAQKSWIVWLARLGYVARGVIYLIVGFFALRFALGNGGEATSPTGALEFIGQQSYGKAMLVVMIIGLAGYSLWGFVRAIFDPLHRGEDGKGLATRAGYVLSGVSYGALLFPAVKLLQSQPRAADEGSTEGIVASLLSQPSGVWLVAGFGVFWIGSALAQFYQAYSKNFMEDLKLGKMGPDEEKWAERLGQVGMAARGVVYTLVGLFMFRSAATADALAAEGIDGALLKIAQQPYGMIMLALVAFGLVLFGLFSVMCARWYNTGRA
jgi:hypothetical protein